MITVINVDTGAATAPKRKKPASTTAPTGNAATPRRATTAPPSADDVASLQPAPSKLDRLAALLAEPAGASIAAMMAATGWQAHSVRGAMAGALKKRGLTITSDKEDGVRIYRAGAKA